MRLLFETFPAALLKISAQASVLAILILVLQRVCKEQLTARARAGLWLVLVMRLLLPVSLSSTASIFNLFPSFEFASPISQQGSVSSIDPQLPTGLLSEHEQISDSSGTGRRTDTVRHSGRNTLSDSYPSFTALAPRTTPARSRTPDAGSPPLRLLGVIWFCGAAGASWVVLLSSIRWARKIRASRQVTDQALLSLLSRCRAEIGIRRQLSLFETSQLSTPALYGFFHPRLLFPVGMLTTYPASQLRFIFLHELAHMRRRDIPLNWLRTGLQILHWFNPVLWIAFKRWRIDRELACDAIALEAAGGSQRREYGQTILRLLETASHPVAAPGFMGILEDKQQLRERISRIASFVPTTRCSPVATLLLSLLFIAGLTDAREAGPVVPAGRVLEGLAEPIYQGRNLSSWLQAFSNPLSPDYTRAKEIFKTAGEEAVPFLLKHLVISHTPLEEAQARFWINSPPKSGVAQTRPKDFENQRAWAAYAFEFVGPSASNALPTLIHLARDDYFLGVRMNLFHSIAALAPNSDFEASAVDALVKNIEGENVDCARSAYYFLGAFPNQAERVIPILIKGLNNSLMFDASLEALQKLGKLGVPALLQAQKQERSTIRPAELALEKIDPDAAKRAIEEKERLPSANPEL